MAMRAWCLRVGLPCGVLLLSFRLLLAHGTVEIRVLASSLVEVASSAIDNLFLFCFVVLGMYLILIAAAAASAAACDC